MPSPVIASTQQHLDLEDVLDDIAILKDGSAAIVIKTNAINFGLLSEEEQDATIYAYAALLNSLTFSVQILIRSELKDISAYLKLLEEQEVRQQNSKKQEQIKNYKKFVSSLITEHNVLEKKFYLVIPFSTLELGVTSSMASQIKGDKQKLPFEKSYILEKAKTNLEPKRDHLLRQLGRLGIAARQLTTQELIQLLFSMYNPGTYGQTIHNTSDYTTPLVQPAFINTKEVNVTDSPNTPADNQNNQSAQSDQSSTPAAGSAPTTGATNPAAPATPAADSTPVAPASGTTPAAPAPGPAGAAGSAPAAPAAPATPSADTPGAAPAAMPDLGVTPTSSPTPSPSTPGSAPASPAAPAATSPTPTPDATAPAGGAAEPATTDDAQSAINSAAADLKTSS